MLQRPTTLVAVVHEVHAPDIVHTTGASSCDAVLADAKSSFFAAFLRHAESFALRYSIDPFVIDELTIQSQSPADHAVATSWMAAHELGHPQHKRHVITHNVRDIPLR